MITRAQAEQIIRSAAAGATPGQRETLVFDPRAKGWRFGSSIGSVFFNVLDYGADPTGVRSSSSAFEAADADAFAVDGIVLVPIGTYLLDVTDTYNAAFLMAGGTVLIDNGVTVTFEGSTTNLMNDDWADETTLGGSVIRGNTFFINSKFGVGGDATFAGSAFFSRNSEMAGSQQEGYVVLFTQIPMTGSGAVGMRFNRIFSATNFGGSGAAMGISFLQDLVEMWSIGLDADGSDSHPDFYIFATGVGDIIRCASLSDGIHVVIGNTIGKPSVGDAFLNINNVAGHTVPTMLAFNNIDDDASVTRIIDAENNGVRVFDVDDLGRIGAMGGHHNSYAIACKANTYVRLGVGGSGSLPADSTLDNETGVIYQDAGTIKMRFKDGSGTAATVTLG